MSYPTRATGRSRPLVRHTYDWATVSPHALLDTVKFPLVTESPFGRHPRHARRGRRRLL